MRKMNKSEVETNKTVITQVTNVLFYKVDKNRLQWMGCISVPMPELINKNNIKNKSKNYISLTFINKT